MTVLGCLDLDHVFRLDRPAALTNESTPDLKSAYEKWERSNRVRESRHDEAHNTGINKGFHIRRK